MLQRAASNAYSWWWASHIRTKQSKWMEQNLQDMEEKVGVIVKLLSEDGDSFAKRAEMYYKKRPELIDFVEESLKAYRSLAERYDHISKELQNANNTIASVFPEQVQFSMEEEDEAAFRKMRKKMPTEFKTNAPQVPKAPSKDLKSVVRLATKKFPNKKTTTASAFSKVVKSGLTKKEGIAEIDKLQKHILVLQTEKEFVKSSYDNGVAKYWQIEESIKGLQEKICNLQDEFGEGKIIEDEEARQLMVATALNSCQETLDRLQEKQDKSSGDTLEEYHRIKEAKQRLRNLKSDQKNSEESSTNSEEDTEASKFLKGDREEEIQKAKGKIKEKFNVKSFQSLTVSQMAEMIDELVNKLVGLETAVSSETAMLKRLRLESDELQQQIKIVEDDKANLTDENNELKNKLREMEEKLEKLLGVQQLNDSLVQQNEELKMQVTEASRNIDLSREVDTVMPDEEKIETDAPLHEEETSSAGNTLNEEVERDHTQNDYDNIKKSNAGMLAQDAEVSDFSGNQHEIPEEQYGEKSREQDITPSATNISGNAGDDLCDSNASQSQPRKSNDDSSLSESVSSNGVDLLCQETGKAKVSSGIVKGLSNVNTEGHGNTQGEELDWKQLYLNGLQDREKVLLTEYTTTLRDYKDVKKRLNELEQKTQTSEEVKELKIAIALKDEEINQLREKLCLMQRSFDGNAELRELKALNNEQNANASGLTGDKTSISVEDELKELLAHQSDSVSLSPIEEKFRTDIDELLEENLDFWLKFSAAFHEIQKFETEARDLQGEAEKIFEKTKSEGSSHGKYSLRSDARPLYKHLMEVQTELAVWLEQSMSLKEEQKSRFSSLCEIQDEITNTLKECAEHYDFKFTSYQAAKFQGEILNMKQENNKVAEELQAGIDHVTTLQTEIEQSLTRLNEEFGLSGPIKPPCPQLRQSDNRNRIPLRSFIFGVKPKKQKPSIFNIKKYNALKL